MSQHSKKNNRAAEPRRAGEARRIPWPLVMIGGGLVLLALALWGLSQSSASPKAPVEVQGAPKLKIDRQKVDLGDVKLGQTVSATFNVSNAGDQTLRFSQAPYIEVVEGC